MAKKKNDTGKRSTGKGSKLKRRTSANKRFPQYQQTNPNAPNYTPF